MKRGEGYRKISCVAVAASIATMSAIAPRGRADIPAGAQSATPDAGAQSATPDAGAQSATPDAGAQSATPDAGAQSATPDIESAIPIASVSPSSSAASVRENETVPVRDNGKDARKLGWTLVVAGGALAIVGGVIGTVGAVRLSAKRDDLEEHCISPSGDLCTHPREGQAEAGESDVEAIKTWKILRTGGFVAAGVGAMIAGVGIARLFTAPPSPKLAGWIPRLQIGPGSAFVSFEGAL